MRKKELKELIERIKNLEEGLKVAKNTKEVLDFVLENGKDGVVIEDNFKGWGVWNYALKYIYKNNLKSCDTTLFHLLGKNIEIIKTDKESIIFSFDDDYYKVNKANATYMSIPEPLFVSKEKEKETKAKKKGAKNET